MAVKVTMPLLSDTMESGKILKWLKAEGDKIESGDAIAEVESDKADMEVSAYTSGVMRKHLYNEGESAKVGALIAIIGEPDEDISSLLSEAAKPVNGKDHGAPTPKPAENQIKEAPKMQATQPAPRPQPQVTAPAKESVQAQVPAGNGGGRIKASPLARKIANETGVELAAVEGTGPGGRIHRRDVEAAGLAVKQAPSKLQRLTAVPAKRGEGDFTERPLSSMRRTIARRLVQSIGPIPTFYLTIEADMANVVAMRKQINQLDENLKISINDFVIKAAAAALVQHPNVNSSFKEDAIIEHHHVDIGMAVAIEAGLITPVLRDADQKGLGQIAGEAKELAARARDRKLTPDEYTGSTFSISNLGMLGIEEFTAIINPPESAILAIGGLVEKPVVVNGELAVSKRMRLTMSCDHRVIDGASGAQFLATLKKILENPVYFAV